MTLTPTNLVTLITGLASSCALPIVIIIALFLFRRPILDGLTSIELGSFKAQFTTSKEKGLIPGIKEGSESQVVWERTGALFWLTNDIMSALAAIHADAPRIVIVDLIKRVLNHATQLHLDDKIIATLVRARDNSALVSEHDWSTGMREYVVTELSRVFNSVGELAKLHENEVAPTEFKPDPD